VVAEGVETAVQLDMLGQLGCDRAQGYYLGQPMEAHAIGPWLIDRRRYGAVTDVGR
jgi:EAL domain-containing protein (putative c-di-GMP-specific phosphodiesterase class I)